MRGREREREREKDRKMKTRKTPRLPTSKYTSLRQFQQIESTETKLDVHNPVVGIGNMMMQAYTLHERCNDHH